ncbi:MAG: TolC family protein [Spirochaetia bacterium]|nr:TolC family protein [Spirochaetia bacterium]
MKAIKIFLYFSCIFYFTLSAQEFSTSSKNEETITVAGYKLNLKEALNLVLKNNLTLRSAKYDVIMSDTAHEVFQKKYTPTVNAETSYQSQKLPVSGSTTFSGDEFYQWQVSASIAKLFSTGTMVSAGIKEVLADSNDPEFGMPGTGFYKPADPALHKPSLFITVQQELLKNSFGYSDQKMAEILYNRSKIQREALINQLSALVVSALIDYWQVSIQKSALENAENQYNSTKNIRDIIAKNIKLGLAEKFDLNQYNSLTASSESRVFLARQQLKEAERKLLRTINLPPETKISGVTNLTDELPQNLDSEDTLKKAFEKRVDFKNSLSTIETSKLELSMYENNALPSLNASFSATTNGQNESFNTAFGDAAAAEYPAWQASVKLSYPIWDKEIKTNLRNAELKLKQSLIKHEDLQKEIRDEVLNRLERVILQHKILMKIRKVREESEIYYTIMANRAKRGRFNSVAVKNALDSISNAKQQELETLVQYNIALLQFDLARNEIFERYEINIEELLEQVE